MRIALVIVGLAVVGIAIWLVLATRASSSTVTAPHHVPIAPPPTSSSDDSRFVPHDAPIKPGRTPIPTGGFAAWTGREGMTPEDVDAFAREAGIRVPVALEQHRSTLLMDRTSDIAALTAILGTAPTAGMLGDIAKAASTLHDVTANAQVHAREGSISDDTSIRLTRDAEDAYRRAYRDATGLSEADFDRFFGADRPIP